MWLWLFQCLCLQLSVFGQDFQPPSFSFEPGMNVISSGIKLYNQRVFSEVILIDPPCLKITQAKMSHLNISSMAFSTNFCPIKIDLSGNAVQSPSLRFQKVAKMGYLQ